MNAIAQMTSALVGIRPVRSYTRPAGNKTAQIRELLREHGELTGKEIARRMGLAPLSLVGALLKHDVQKGLVVRTETGYRIDESFDQAQRDEITAAIVFLKRHGYTVTKERTC